MFPTCVWNCKCGWVTKLYCRVISKRRVPASLSLGSISMTSCKFVAITSFSILIATAICSYAAAEDQFKCDNSVDYPGVIDEWQERHYPGYDEPYDGAITHPELRDTLLDMGDLDQKYRQPSQTVTVQDAKEMRRIDYNNMESLKSIIDQHGLPTLQMVGAKAMNRLWAILVHAPDTDFQKKILPLIKNAAANGGMKKERYAYVYDRMAMREGHPQKYGTQMICDYEKEKIVPYKLDDPNDIDSLRKEVRLYPLAYYVCAMRQGFPDACKREQE